MSRLRLILRTIAYHRAATVALGLGVAVGTAVLTGSLLVGESVRGSLVSAVERRLGDVDHIVSAARFFPASLCERLQKSNVFRRDFVRAEPLVTASGTCTAADGGARASRVTIYGRRGVERGACVVSEALARVLGAEEGATVVLRTARTGNLPLDLPIAGEAGELAILRVRIARVAPRRTMEGAFSLYGDQRPQKNCWVSIGDLGRALGFGGSGQPNGPDRANVILVAAKPHARGGEGARSLARALSASASLEDYGVKIRSAPDGALVVEYDGILIRPALERKLLRAPGEKRRVFAYLADSCRDERTGRECPYSMVAGVDSLPGGDVRPGEIVLNGWAADDLGASPGDRIALEFSVRDDAGLVRTGSRAFRLARVIETQGPGADRTLVPHFEGITDAESVAEWDPPRDFDFRIGRIRPRDEEYWKRFRAAPKAFVGLEEAREIWGTRLGELTSVRYRGVARGALEAALRGSLAADEDGEAPAWNARPIRAELLAAASGSTDFGQLFVGLSFFIVAAAALLVALLMRLHVEGRARQAGALYAVGFTRSAVRWLFAAEGLMTAIAGSLVGVVCGLGFAWLMTAGLRTLWVGAVGTSHIELHAGWTPLATGFGAGFFVSGLAILQGVRRVETAPISQALSGRPEAGGRGTGRAWPEALGAGLAFASAAGLCLASLLGGVIDSTAAFLGAGTCLLVALLVGSRAWFVRRAGARRDVLGSLFALAARNTLRYPTRSTLTIGLLASGTFITIAVGSMRTGADFDPSRRDGPSGGYSLVAEFDTPVPYDISSPEGRKLLALRETDVWSRVEMASLRAAPGEDVSCRNLYRPAAPRVMSVPGEFAAAGAFSFDSAVPGREAAWELLDAARPGQQRSPDDAALSGQRRSPDNAARQDSPEGDRAVPVIADYATARWILHVGLGETLWIRDESGAERRARVVAFLKESIFQSELLVSEDAFGELYPGRSGFGRVLVRASEEDSAAVARELVRALSDFGVTIQTTRERMASFAEVRNTYISAFQALGGLGLLLGSVGLVVVLARGVVERRSEIALMGAVGFGRAKVAMLFAAENVMLLAFGTLAGAASAALAVAPEFARSGAASRLGGTFALFCGIVAVVSGVLALAGAVLVRDVSPAALRRE